MISSKISYNIVGYVSLLSLVVYYMRTLPTESFSSCTSVTPGKMYGHKNK